ncbi:MAG: 30S ribosome-binding factor RbfA [Bacteroidales bacterium]|jgi:ribosome-binding factor A|nr:30S ribosome-binding factor RbfA [Bacteroidales bacterium]MCI2121127.1 30S ribosome-binding factor RbfA [Bacteroidales bacterium]MCI2144942.1 30S ribosome-binding factor RbfA [Bacteroidales bacterium]
MQNVTLRQERVASQLKRDLADIIRQRGMAAFDGALVTVVEVRISPDLAVAKVYLSIFPTGKTASVMETISQNAKSIRGELGHRVSKQLRIVPELTFFVDDSLDYAEHIDEILKRTKTE